MIDNNVQEFNVVLLNVGSVAATLLNLMVAIYFISVAWLILSSATLSDVGNSLADNFASFFNLYKEDVDY